MLQSPLINLLMVVLPKEKMVMGSGLRGLMNGLGSTFGVSMAALFVEQQQTVHALLFSEDQSVSPIGAAEAVAAAQERLQVEGARPRRSWSSGMQCLRRPRCWHTVTAIWRLR
jgi:hypothetical protein